MGNSVILFFALKACITYLVFPLSLVRVSCMVMNNSNPRQNLSFASENLVALHTIDFQGAVIGIRTGRVSSIHGQNSSDECNV